MFLRFISSKISFSITVEPLWAALDVLSIFYKSINNKICIEMIVIKMTEELRNRYEEFINSNLHDKPILNKVRAELNKIKIGEYFIISFHDTNEMEIFCENIVKYLDDGLTMEKSLEKTRIDMKTLDFHLGTLLSNYELKTFGTEIRTKIGNTNKKEKICRFCGKSEKSNPPATFRQKAHAISEALGFKNIIAREECDLCNKKFGDTIEQDLIEYFKPTLIFSGIKGKNGVPEFKNNKMRIKNTSTDKEKTIEFHLKEQIVDKENGEFSLNVVSQKSVCPANIYKSLCKYTLSVIPDELLENFKDTIKWIVSEEKDNKLLPKVARQLGICQHEFSIFIRKNDDISLPYMFCILGVGLTSLAYIVPFSSKDKLEFLKDEEYKHFLSTVKILNNSIFNDFSSYEKIEPKTTINFKQSTNSQV